MTVRDPIAYPLKTSGEFEKMICIDIFDNDIDEIIRHSSRNCWAASPPDDFEYIVFQRKQFSQINYSF